MNRKIISFCIACLIPIFMLGQDREKQGISEAIQSGNAPVLSGYFAENVDLTLLDVEDVYSRKQAEVILAKFFQQNQPISYTIKHEGKSKVEDFYYIGELSTKTDRYRITFFLKKSEDRFTIKQLRIELDG